MEKVLGFGDYFIEAIETTPTFLETHFDWSKQGTGTSDWAFDELTVVREFGPLPLYLSVIPEGQNLQFYWSTPSTNYVYTLEGKQSLASTNWLATPGAASPLKTNHCTLPLTNNPVPFYRVRAE